MAGVFAADLLQGAESLTYLPSCLESRMAYLTCSCDGRRSNMAVARCLTRAKGVVCEMFDRDIDQRIVTRHIGGV